MSQEKSRLFKALNQTARRLEISPDLVPGIVKKTNGLVNLCGEQSRSRQMKFNIGSVLLRGNTRIVAPACPDYSHNNGAYTFRGLNSGISLLSRLHIEFLKKVYRFMPEAKISILIADQEAEDNALCQAVGKSREEFLSLINGSISATQAEITKFGWEAQAMTDAVPNLLIKEQEEAEIIRNDPGLSSRIKSDTMARAEMYYRIGRFSAKEMEKRTIRTAAQYRVMAKFARANNFLVCNHSTVNLSWYREIGAAVLHNLVSVY